MDGAYHAGQIQSRIEREATLVLLDDTGGDAPEGLTLAGEYEDLLAKAESVITSYSIHYTKLYDRTCASTRGRGAPHRLW